MERGEEILWTKMDTRAEEQGPDSGPLYCSHFRSMNKPGFDSEFLMDLLLGVFYFYIIYFSIFQKYIL